MRMKRREAQRQGPRDVRELGHAGVRLDCWNSSPSGCDRPPPGMTLQPGFLSHGDVRFAPVIFRQDTGLQHERGDSDESFSPTQA